MKKMRFLRDSKGKKVGVILSMAEFKRLVEDSEEIECIRAYDAAKVSDETLVPYAQVLRTIKLSRK